MAKAAGKIGYKALVFVFATPTGIAVKKALDVTWRKARGAKPPKKLEAADTLTEALLWVVASTTAISMARLIAIRGAAAAYRSLTGNHPPADPKANQKRHEEPEKVKR